MGFRGLPGTSSFKFTVLGFRGLGLKVRIMIFRVESVGLRKLGHFGEGQLEAVSARRLWLVLLYISTHP